jgi:hypothetical protein
LGEWGFLKKCLGILKMPPKPRPETAKQRQAKTTVIFKFKPGEGSKFINTFMNTVGKNALAQLSKVNKNKFNIRINDLPSPNKPATPGIYAPQEEWNRYENIMLNLPRYVQASLIIHPNVVKNGRKTNYVQKSNENVRKISANILKGFKQGVKIPAQRNARELSKLSTLMKGKLSSHNGRVNSVFGNPNLMSLIVGPQVKSRKNTINHRKMVHNSLNYVN